MITVVNIHHNQPVPENAVRVYVGRPSALGNQFSHLGLATSAAKCHVATREEAIARYRDWLARNLNVLAPFVCAEMDRLFGLLQSGFKLELACFCAPKSCHADVIKEILERRLDAK